MLNTTVELYCLQQQNYVAYYSRTILPTTVVSHLTALQHPPTLNQQTVPASAGYSTTDIREIFNNGFSRDIQQQMFTQQQRFNIQ